MGTRGYLFLNTKNVDLRPIVIKYGGSLLEEPDHRRAFLQQIAALAKKEKVILVHGGGKEITKAFDQAGIRTVFKQGLRVTPDAKAMQVVESVLKSINRTIVEELNELGVEARGFSGKDQGLMLAQVMDEKELGLVGLPKVVDPIRLEVIVTQKALPVFYSVAPDEKSRTLNINADEFAWKLAVSYPGQAKRLIFLTDSGGILKGGKLIKKIAPYQVQSLVDSQVITGGMTVKAFACRDAILMGVPQVDIAKNITCSSKNGGLEIEGTSFMKAKSTRISHGHKSDHR
jgi:acetylglutamate kinase